MRQRALRRARSDSGKPDRPCGPRTGIEAGPQSASSGRRAPRAQPPVAVAAGCPPWAPLASNRYQPVVGTMYVRNPIEIELNELGIFGKLGV